MLDITEIYLPSKGIDCVIISTSNWLWESKKSASFGN